MSELSNSFVISVVSELLWTEESWIDRAGKLTMSFSENMRQERNVLFEKIDKGLRYLGCVLAFRERRIIAAEWTLLLQFCAELAGSGSLPVCCILLQYSGSFVDRNTEYD